MAVRDFKQYLVQVQGQYLEMKADLDDFNKALADGFITEDKLQAAKDEVAVIEQNYQRLLYVAYLLEIPNRPYKATKFKKANNKLATNFSTWKSDSNAIFDENKSALDSLRKELKKIKK